MTRNVSLFSQHTIKNINKQYQTVKYTLSLLKVKRYQHENFHRDQGSI